MDTGTNKKPSRKRLSELLVEAGIVKAEELPKGLEYAQKASDSDIQAVAEVKELITEQGLSVPTALRALTLSKQRRCTITQALTELGWRSRKVEPTQGHIKSTFNPDELDAIGSGKPLPKYSSEMQRSSWTGLKVRAQADLDVASKYLKGEEVEIERKAVPPPVMPGDARPAIGPAPSKASDPSSFYVEEDPYKWASKIAPEAVSWAEHDASWEPDHSTSSYQESHEEKPQPDEQRWSAYATESTKTVEDVALPPTFVQSMRDGDLLFSEHSYDGAEKAYADALTILDRTPEANALEMAELLVKMGRSTLQLSEFARAEEYFCRALKIREDAFGRDDIAVAECLDYLAEVYDLQSQYLEAEQYYLGALGIKERVLSQDNSEVSRSLKKLVAVSKRRGGSPGEDKRSGELLTEAGLIDPSRLEEGLKTAEEKAVPIGRALISLNYLTDDDLQAVLQAQLLLREGVIPAYLAVRALRLASQQRVTLESALREIGLEPEDAAGKHVFDLLKAAQELLDAERELDPNDPNLVVLCVKVGDVYADHQQYQQAEVLYKRALQIKEAAASDEVAEILSRLADLKFRQQSYDDALDMYTKLLDVWECKVGTENINFINCLESLAGVHYVKADYKESGRLYQLAINGKEKLLGPEHPGLAPALQGRANCYYACQRYNEAEQMYRRALNLHEKVYGANNEQSAILFNMLGDVYYVQGIYDKAQREYSKGLEAFSNSTNPDVWAFSSMLEKAADCFVKLNEHVKAVAYYAHLIKTREAFGTATAPDLAEPCERYASLLDSLHRAEEAQTIRQHAQKCRTATTV